MVVLVFFVVCTEKALYVQVVIFTRQYKGGHQNTALFFCMYIFCVSFLDVYHPVHF